MRARLRVRLETQIVGEVCLSPQTPRQIAAEFRRKVRDGESVLRPAGEARRDPGILLERYAPRYRIDVFGTTLYLTHLRHDENLGFFVAYVGMRDALHPRIFYKDISLVWRCATHWIRSEHDNWIGKGDLKTYVEDGELMESSAEETTDLPLEIQAALDTASRAGSASIRDDRAVPLVLRRAPDGRFEPYADFVEPRRRAAADPRNRIHGGRSVARFTRSGDPTSLVFVKGFEPDLARGVVQESRSKSRLYGGAIRKFRVLSRNREIQYQFIKAPRHVWIIPPQALTTELSTYGVRTVDVHVDEDLCVPGFEYHYVDDSTQPPTLHSQIPEGFAGAASDVDPSRADASAWLDRLPVVQRFRRALARGGLARRRIR
jgi:hypothetical protein